MNLDQARAVATEIISDISPFCIRVEIAGSIRREKIGEIKDIEIVAIPNLKDWDKLTKLRDMVNRRWGKPMIGDFPSKYTKVRAVYPIDFFWTDELHWGLCFFIRTGCAAFAARALAHWKKITGGGYSQDCMLHRADGTPVPTPEEQDVFKALKSPFIAPSRRIEKDLIR